ncbi:MAG: acyl-CoA dehydrogenase C-terminal domain-containing protein [Actinomycetales bacterium]|jgi:alkylation response protein AidB-like acyl-CoA dehydrogenase|nr:acyl-CoA dehydrogenase C-terminal domain-containing protein [Actinomycetales bacterium]
MGHYIANLRDIQFCLFDLLGREEILGKGLFADIDKDTANGMLEEFKRLAENEIAASFVDGDRLGVEFDPKTGEGKLPESFKKSFNAYMDAEWWRIDAPVELGGTLIPRSLRWAMAEMILGANPALHIYVSTSFAHVCHTLGTDEQKKIAKQMIDKGWTATMVLTEPDAGSDVGAGRSKAVKQADGTWHLTGTKRFITSGENDLSENIVHFVLARPEGGAVGTKGLSLFIVPKYKFNWDTGELGERNGIYATRLEHKMGLNVSATAEINMGEKEPCVGYLLGEVHDGIRQMFKIIEYARMMVGTKAISTLSTGYLNALSYAKSRVQGPDLTKQLDKASPRVTIIHHPDVRRSLLTQKAYAEGMRALVLYTASIQDSIMLENDEAKKKQLEALNDLLLPIVKGYGSEKSWTLLGTESLQTFGGSGFTQDWPLEQYVRDAKIDTLYEGTTAIQGLDFFFRKIVRDNGATLMTLGTEIKNFCESGGALADEKAKLLKALGDFQGIITTLVGHAMASQSKPEEIYKVGLNTTRALFAAGDVIIGWLLLRMAEIATTKGDDDFYIGKIAAAKHFVNVVLPHLTAERKIAEATDGSIMEIPEKAF